jgi:hypothetical protein
MYEIILTVINSKKYDLSGLLKKIDTLWVQGEITDEQRLELIDLARENALSGNSIDLIEKLKSLEQEVNTLKERVAALETPPESDGEEIPEEEETIPEFAIGKWYYTGEEIMFNGIHYKCIVPAGSVCVWSPADYPAYWQEVIDELTEGDA